MQLLKYSSVTTFVVLLASVNALPQAAKTGLSTRVSNIPTKIIASVTVLDTPIVKAAQAYARAYSDDMTFNHVMRSWLFGVIIINKNATQRAAIDLETHAVTAILHDLSQDNTGELVSKDKRFKVNGAITAQNFIDTAILNGTAYRQDKNRKQLVQDTITLYTTPTIFAYKRPVVAITAVRIISDF